MIETPTVLNVGSLVVEANWNEASTPGKAFKFTFIDDKGKHEATVTRDELYGLLFLFGDDDQQTHLIPVQSTNVRVIKRQMKIRAKTNIKKGDIITVSVDNYVPERTYEHLLNKPQYTASDKDSGALLSKYVNKR